MLQYPILIVYSMSMHNDPSTATHTYCDARAHNRSIDCYRALPSCLRRPITKDFTAVV